MEASVVNTGQDTQSRAVEEEEEEEDNDAPVNIADEVDSPLVTLGTYCNKFIEKYGSRKRAKILRKNTGLTKNTIPDDSSDIYDFNHPRRGLAVIINNERYPTNKGGFHEREGSKRDASSLEKIFRHLGFKVKRYNDLTKNEMLSKLQRAASNTIYDHGKADAFACAILAHGYQKKARARGEEYAKLVRHDIVYGVDWEFVPTKYLLSLFNDECCPELQGKPRMFFIQACRGKAFDKGADVTGDVPTNNKKTFFKREFGKEHDDQDAASSDSELGSCSDSESESELSSYSELESEQEEEGQSESMKDQEFMSVRKEKEDGTRKPGKGGEEVSALGDEQAWDTERSSKGKTKFLAMEEHPQRELEENEEKENKPKSQLHKMKKMQSLNQETVVVDRCRPASSQCKGHTVPNRDVITISPAPLYRDFLLVYAAPPGYFAWRNKKEGGWLIQGLKSVLLTKDVTKVSFLRLLTRVSSKVAKECKSSNRDPELSGKKAIPCVMSMLTKDIYFRRKDKMF